MLLISWKWLWINFWSTVWWPHFSDDNLWVFDDTHSEAFKASQRNWSCLVLECKWRRWRTSVAVASVGMFQLRIVDEFEPGDPRLEAAIYKAGDLYTIKVKALSLSVLHGHQRVMVFVNTLENVILLFAAAYAPNGGLQQRTLFPLCRNVIIIRRGINWGWSYNWREKLLYQQWSRARVGLGATKIADARKALRHENVWNGI